MTNNQPIDYTSALAAGREHLDNSDVAACLALLVPLLKQQESQDGFASAGTNKQLLETMQLAGEAFLEHGDTQEAYSLLQVAASADPTGAAGGIEKFLWLGQLTGGREGISYYELGVNGLKREISNAGNNVNTPDMAFKRKKLSDAFCGVIEIWMTDLCMEPEAEARCDALITEAMLTDAENPETWNVMGSIRISQQRNEEAKSALAKSWDLYHQQLADAAAGATNSTSSSALRIQEQQQQQIPSLIRLAQNSVEMGLLRNVVEITAEIQRLDDQVAESYYLHGLARSETYNQLKAQAESAASSADEKRKLARDANKNAVRAREAYEALIRLATQEPDLVDPELAPTVTENLAALPSAISAEDYDSSDEEDEDINVDDLE